MKGVPALALDLVCEIARIRLHRIFSEQMEKVRKHEKACDIIIYPPTSGEINAVMAAMAEARDIGIHDALGPVIREVDNLKKGPARDVAQRLYDELHAMKSTSVALAK